MLTRSKARAAAAAKAASVETDLETKKDKLTSSEPPLQTTESNSDSLTLQLDQPSTSDISASNPASTSSNLPSPDQQPSSISLQEPSVVTAEKNDENPERLFLLFLL